jgi:nicotinamide-nucleotide amidase
MTPRAASPATAAVVTVGTELVSGIAVDTNTAEIALALARADVEVREAVSIGDDVAFLAATLRRLVADLDLVVVTGGLGPTHDDITREAACAALGLSCTRDEAVERRLRASTVRHTDPRARERMLVQADILDGARVIPAVKGTAPGQVVPTPRGSLVLLPGPPREMRPLLASFVSEIAGASPEPYVLRTAGMAESDVQLVASDVLGDRSDIALTVLAKLGDVRVILFGRGASASQLRQAGEEIAARLGDAVYSTDGSTLPQAVLALARTRGATIALAESCTGGLVSAALTDIPDASDVFAGSVVSYANGVKSGVLGVPDAMLARHGAVSEEVARAMAEGVREITGATFSVAVTGIAGPTGGSTDRPVGTVWFALASPAGTTAFLRTFTGDRDAVRERSTATALDTLRRALST